MKRKLALKKKIKQSFGRNNQGVITVRHKSSGHKKLYRLVDFKRMIGSFRILSIERDPFRSSRIALVEDIHNPKNIIYILAHKNAKIGDVVISDNISIPNDEGNSTLLMNVNIGSKVHNIESVPGRGGKFVRSAGTYAQVLQKREDNYVLLRMPSKELRYINGKCKCTIGTLSNETHSNLKLYKAGQNRHRGIRPTVRGVAMSSEHPHSGGEGRTGTKRHPQSYTGVPTKGYKTVRKVSKLIIKRRHV